MPHSVVSDPEAQERSRFGHAVASARDTDGDGYSDILVGANYRDHPELNEGNAFLYAGSADGIDAARPRLLDNPSGQPAAQFSQAVAGVGDLNGDGYADVVIGAPQYENPEEAEGTVFLYYGGRDGLPASPDLTLDNPTDTIQGFFGYAIACGPMPHRHPLARAAASIHPQRMRLGNRVAPPLRRPRARCGRPALPARISACASSSRGTWELLPPWFGGT
jgi:hypothetical protein